MLTYVEGIDINQDASVVGNIGAPDVDRVVYLCTLFTSGASAGPVTVDGITMEVLSEIDSGFYRCGIFCAKIPTGTSALFEFTSPGFGGAVAIYTGLSTKTAAQIVADAEIINSGTTALNNPSVVFSQAGDLLLSVTSVNSTEVTLTGDIVSDYSIDTNSNEWSLTGHLNGASAGSETTINGNGRYYVGVSIAPEVTVPEFTAQFDNQIPVPSIESAGNYSAPGINANVTATLGAPALDAIGEQTLPTIEAGLTGVLGLPMMSSDADIAVPEFSADFSGVIPLPEIIANGSYFEPGFFGQVNSILGLPTIISDSDITVPAYSSDLNSTLDSPVLSSAAALETPGFSGNLNITLPVPTLLSTAGVEAASVDASVDVLLGAPLLEAIGSQIVAGEYTGIVNVTIPLPQLLSGSELIIGGFSDQIIFRLEDVREVEKVSVNIDDFEQYALLVQQDYLEKVLGSELYLALVTAPSAERFQHLLNGKVYEYQNRTRIYRGLKKYLANVWLYLYADNSAMNITPIGARMFTDGDAEYNEALKAFRQKRLRYIDYADSQEEHIQEYLRANRLIYPEWNEGESIEAAEDANVNYRRIGTTFRAPDQYYY